MSFLLEARIFSFFSFLNSVAKASLLYSGLDCSCGVAPKVGMEPRVKPVAAGKPYCMYCMGGGTVEIIVVLSRA